jgi:DNA-binding response OmpR family regulator
MDDDPREWTRGAEHLMRCGYRVIPIPATLSGVQWVSAIAPNVIVLEVDLQEGDGMSLLRAIRTDNPSIPIVIYSRTDRYRDDFISWLADDYLHKMEDGAPLCDAIDTVLAAHQ